MPKKQPQTEPAHSILFAPANLPAPCSAVNSTKLLEKIAPALKFRFNERQCQAFERSFNERVSLVWGPPGTGKTTVLAGIVLGWLKRAEIENKPISICVGASNYNPIDKALGEAFELVAKSDLKNKPRFIRVRSQHAAPSDNDNFEDVVRDAGDAATVLAQNLNQPQTSWLVGGTNRQLGKLAEGVSDEHRSAASWFDLLIIDEASQMQVAQAAAYFLLLKEAANVVLAGDHWQLGPIYNFDMRGEMNGDGLLDSIFTFLGKTNGVTRTALNENYRNNGEIAEWSKNRFYPEGFIARNPNRRLQISIDDKNAPNNWTSRLVWSKVYHQILDPNLPVIVVTYGEASYTVSNSFEAQTVAALVWLYRQLLIEQTGNFNEEYFWRDQLGVITPHRAQMALIRNKLIEAGLPAAASPFVDTVDRFQGLERDFVIASYSVADADFIRAEESFILNPRRFNVTMTRPRRKFVMLVSNALVQHLPSDIETAREAAHLQLFVSEYCSETTEISLPSADGQSLIHCRLKTPRI